MKNRRSIFFLCGVVFGAVLLTIVSMSMGWVVSSGRAHVSALEMSDKAVQTQLAKICMFQFNAESDHAGMLEKMSGLNDWQREKYVEDHGWAKMPGSTSSVSGVARQCAVGLTKASS